MFNDRIDYSHPEVLPYSSANGTEVIGSWVIVAVFAAVGAVALLGF